MHPTTNLLLGALGRASVRQGDSLETIAEKLRVHLSPTVEVVEESETKLVLEITSSLDASLFDGVTCGNQHLHIYTFDGKMSGLTRIGHCDHTVSRLCPNAILTEISKVRLTRVVKAGQAVRITIEKIPDTEQTNRIGTEIRCSLSGCIAETGKEIFEPCEVSATIPHSAG